MDPLANKIRPKNINEFIGQEHLVGEDGPIRLAIENKEFISFILWGPPGVGKTTLARIYAESLEASFFELSAVSAGKEDIRKITTLETESRKVLFLDEIHRFNKAQQDFLLPFVENGELVLIGATTENPSFEVIPALLSRSKIFILNKLSDDHLGKILKRAGISMDKESEEFLIWACDGDARSMLSLIEGTYSLYKKVTTDNLKKVLQKKTLNYDKKGDEHYNTISAFIKSMRASQADAALYYLARMIEAGEDPKFIARRMIIFASEDIGQAQPTALVVANEVFRAVENIGLPEAQINLAHGTVYLSESKKDRSAYEAYFSAMSDVQKYGNLPIPLNIRNASNKVLEGLKWGEGYKKYDKESYLPEKLKNKKYYKKSK